MTTFQVNDIVKIGAHGSYYSFVKAFTDYKVLEIKGDHMSLCDANDITNTPCSRNDTSLCAYRMEDFVLVTRPTVFPDGVWITGWNTVTYVASTSKYHIFIDQDDNLSKESINGFPRAGFTPKPVYEEVHGMIIATRNEEDTEPTLTFETSPELMMSEPDVYNNKQVCKVIPINFKVKVK
jgi:hypothetical protein